MQVIGLLRAQSCPKASLISQRCVNKDRALYLPESSVRSAWVIVSPRNREGLSDCYVTIL